MEDNSCDIGSLAEFPLDHENMVGHHTNVGRCSDKWIIHGFNPKILPHMSHVNITALMMLLLDHIHLTLPVPS